MAPKYLAILGEEGDFEYLDYCLKLREKNEKKRLVPGIEPRSMGWKFRDLSY